MPKFARPNSYNGKQSNQDWTGSVRAANVQEVAAGLSQQLYISPATLATAIGTLLPAASEIQAGIAEIATTAEVTTGTDDTRIVSPLKLAQRLASPPAIGSGTPAAGTFTAVTATTGNITATLGNIIASAGSVAAATTVTAGTSITATLGNITATNGNFVKNTAGNKDVYTSLATTTTAGANSAGTVTLVGGTATINTTAVTAASKIRIYRQGVGATGAAATGNLSIGTIVAATSFVINAVSAADATALATTDVSVIFWEIVN